MSSTSGTSPATRRFKRTGRLVSVGFVISALVSLALVAIVIWGIIELVGWVKTK